MVEVKKGKSNRGDSGLGNSGNVAKGGVRLEIAPEPSLDALGRLFSDTQGSPSETYRWTHFGRVMNERKTELGFPYLNSLEPSFNEIIENENRVRRHLYEL